MAARQKPPSLREVARRSRDGRSGTAEPRKAGIDEKCAHARIFGVKCCTVERLCGIMIKTMKAAEGVLPKIFLHQCLFHQFQLFKALLYGLLLPVCTFHK